MIQDIFPHKLNNQFRPGQVPESSDFFVHYDGERVLCRMDGERVALPRVGDMNGRAQNLSSDSFPISDADGLPEREALSPVHTGMTVSAAKRLIYLFDLDGERFFLCPDDAVDVPDGYEYTPVRSFRRKDTDQKALIFALITARHLSDWYRRSRYCGGCGHFMRPSETERAMVCPSCGRTFYPRINPAVIVGVTNGDNLLLTKYAGRVTTHYALVAGFTEIGETFEETVAREVMEETGLEVTNIRYYKSQPWGFADDILTGYYCDVVGSPEIHLDRHELKMAVWMPRQEITGQPDDFSLTNEMMIAFRDGLV